ncbi:RNA-binding protein [Acrasis kona]|uniref:RNA-binding protein n=1 Tax=Acrasis kona TaxID=1008807 RepID=A0AAW2Z6N0_9EUKA
MSTSPTYHDSERGRSRRGEYDEYKKRSRSRSNSRDRSYRRRSDGHRSSRSDNYRSRSPSRSPDRGYDRRHDRYRDSKRPRRDSYSREEPPLAPVSIIPEVEREKRTVFISRLPATVVEKDIVDFFNICGRVREVQLIRDRFTGKSKGFAYVELAEESSVIPALSLNGRHLRGFQVLIKQSEKNTTQLLQTPSQGMTKLYIGDIPLALIEDDLRELFAAVGSVESLEIKRDEKGESKRYGFVKYKKPEEARKALVNINGIKLYNDYVLKVGLWNETKAMETGGPDYGGNDLELEGETQVTMTAQQRFAMLQNFNMQSTPTIDTTPSIISNAPVNSSDQMATRNIRLSNMFDPEQEEGDFEEEIKGDVEGECSKFGNILHIFVDRNSAGHVYLRFDNVNAAKSAHQALNGRWFAQKMITSEYLSEITYQSKFPDAQK